MNGLLLVIFDLMVLFIYFVYIVHYKLSTALKRENKEYHIWQSAVIALVILISPILILNKWNKSGELEKQAEEAKRTKVWIIKTVILSTFWDTGGFLDHLAKKYSEEKYSKISVSIRNQQILYSQYYRQICCGA